MIFEILITKNKYNRLINNWDTYNMVKIWSSLGVLFSANIISQIVSIAIMPIVTRLYSPDALGTYQVIITISLILSPFIRFSLDQAIIKSYQKNLSLFHASTKIVFLFSVLWAIIGSLYLYLFTDLHSFNTYLLLFLLMYLGSIFALSQALILQKLSYKEYSKNNIKYSIYSNGLKVVFGTFNRSSITLLLSLIIAYTSILWRSGIFSKIFSSTPSLISPFKTLKKHKDFTLYRTGSSFIDILTNWHIVLIAPLIASTQEIGLLALAIMMTKTPSYPFLQSICSFNYSQGTNKRKIDKELLLTITKTSIFGFVCAIFVIAIFNIWGIKLVTMVFGNNWEGVENYVTILLLPIAISFGLTPFTYSISNLLNKQKNMLVLDAITLIFFALLAIVSISLNFNLYYFLLFNSLLSITSIIMKFLTSYFLLRKTLCIALP